MREREKECIEEDAQYAQGLLLPTEEGHFILAECLTDESSSPFSYIYSTIYILNILLSDFFSFFFLLIYVHDGLLSLFFF